MAAYVTQSELRSLWKSSLKGMIRKIRTNKEIPEGLVELIKHNFFAKYVSYDAAQESVEIGVNESRHRAIMYPSIKVYTFPLENFEEKLRSSYRSSRRDLKFYAKVFKGKAPNEEVVVL